uniref:Tetratricopeptide repeat protein n=1 Tax=candidate division WOR-3 bacterium TaxID=2052148 RepID=A0A7C4GFD5_UNCW3
MFALAMFVLIALAPEHSRDLVDQYNRAQSAIEQQDYSRAAAILSGLVRSYGSGEFGDELRYALAECYFNMGRHDRALDIFTRLLDRPRQSYIKPEAAYGAAVSCIMIGNYARARSLLEKLAKEPGYSTDPRTSFAQGVLHYFERNYQLAADKLEGLTIPEAKFYLAKSYAQLGRPLPALVNFNEITSDIPNTPLATMAHLAAGIALFTNRDYDGAKAKFRYFLDNFSYSPLADYARYFLGCALISQGDHAPAIDQLMPLTRHNNNLLAAHANYFVGYAYLSLGKAREAVERFQRVKANYPRTKVASFASLQLSEAMLTAADTLQTLLAASQLSRIFSTGELSGVGNYMSGVVYYQIGDYAKAASQFESILVNHSDTQLREPACSMLLLTLNSSGQFEKCIAIGSKYVSDYPSDNSGWRSQTLFFLADGFYYARKFSEADAYYQRAYVDARSPVISAYARLGRCYSLYHLGRLDEALNGFKGLVVARPSDTLFTIAAYLGYGYCYFNQKEYSKALDVFEALANTFPSDSLAAVPGLFYAGYCYYQLKYYGQAIDAWTALMNRFPENNLKAAEAAFRGGDTYFKALEYDKAIASFNFVIERYPFSTFGPPSQALIAQCYYNRRQYDDAIREYQKFLDLYPSDPQGPGVRKSLEMSYYLAGQGDSSVMEEFLRRFPQSEMAADGQYAKGKALFDAGKYEQAVAELQKTVVNFPGSPVAGDAQLLTAESYSQLKRWNDAATAYRKFIDYFPTHEQRAGGYFNMAIAHFNSGSYQASLEAFQVVIDSFPESEYASSARSNAESCRRRLGVGDMQQVPADASATLPVPQDISSPTTEGDKNP